MTQPMASELVIVNESLPSNSEALFRQIAESVDAVFYVTDLPGNRVCYISPAYERLWGLDPQALYANQEVWTSLIHPDDKRRVAGAFEAFASGRSAFDVEYRIKLPDGRQRWVRDRAHVAARGHAGEILRIAGMAEDVTKRKETERAFQRSEDRYQALFESIDEGFCIIEVLYDDDGRPTDYRFLEVNPAFERHTGILNAVGRRMREIAPEHEAHWFETYGRVASTGEPQRFQQQAAALNRFYDVYAFRIGTPDERRVAVLFNDIAERLQAENALRQSEAKLNTVIERLPVGVGIVDGNGRTQLLNPAALRLHGFASLDDMLVHFEEYREHFELRYLDRRVMRSDEWPLARALRGEFVRDYEVRLRTPGGEERVIAYSSEPAPDGEGGQIVFLMHDVTERRRAEEALRDADRRKDEFLATLAHELRNPLAPIRNAIHLLKLEAKSEEPHAEVLNIMDRQVNQMVRLIDDLLDVSRITRGKIQLRVERVQLSDVVASALEAVQPMIDDFRHQLTVVMPDASIYLSGDATRLAQIFSNLLGNAAKYTQRGGHIWLAAEHRGSEVAVSVRDTGIGIDAEQLPQIFEMFSQAAPAIERAQGGLGIGLSLVRGLVELHGGAIEARSGGRGMGSEFIVRLPVTDAPEEQQVGPINPVELPLHARRVLVVDDNHDSANSLAMLLRIKGHEIRTAHDGVEAIQAAATFRPHLVLLDIGMPKMNGYDAAREMRKHPWGAAMKLVAMTGWGQDDDKRKAAEAGFDVHLTKPINPTAVDELLFN
jgi:PAS domain S-box-containing protein